MAALDPDSIGPGPKLTEDDEWDDVELAVRGALEARLRDDGWEGWDSIDEVLLLQVIRGYHYEERRVEATYGALRRLLEWRRDIGADTLLSSPPPQVVADHAEWRRQWHMDIYGEDATRHPIMGHRLGSLHPATFIDRFPVDEIKLNYARDMEFLQWHKKKLSRQGPNRVYKQISVLDMTNLSFAHTTARFRTPIGKVVAMLQDFYPEGTTRVYIVNAPMIFRVMWYPNAT